MDNDKTKIPDEFILRRVSLVCFIAELDELIHNWCTCVKAKILSRQETESPISAF